MTTLARLLPHAMLTAGAWLAVGPRSAGLILLILGAAAYWKQIQDDKKAARG